MALPVLLLVVLLANTGMEPTASNILKLAHSTPSGMAKPVLL